jgi:RNA polymerase sigma factor (TIGR02999 family)
MSEAQIERLVISADQGDAQAREQLFVTLYQELHRIAQRELRRNSASTLSPTTLLHETFIKLTGSSAPFTDRGRFIAYTARSMRALLIDYLRRRHAQKRGGAFEITSLPTELPEALQTDVELERIGEALESLGAADPQLAELVDLKFFCGFKIDDIAVIRGVSERTVRRDWEKARIFLHRFIKDGSPDS